MSSKLPDPPIPSINLRAFKTMPLEVQRLRSSKAWLIAKRRPEIGFYSLNLWAVSWHEVPAGSLEDDDDVLADAAMCPPEKWQKAKDETLRGWRKFSDGRLYHPVVVEKVAEAGTAQLLNAWRRECDRIRKENKRRKEKQEVELSFPPEPAAISARWAMDFQRPSDGIPAENALKGREGKGREGNPKVDSVAASDPSPREVPSAQTAAAAPPDLSNVDAIGEAACVAAGMDPGRLAVDFAVVGNWIKNGFDPDREILPAIRAKAAMPGYRPPSRLGWFTNAIADFRATLHAPAPKGEARNGYGKRDSWDDGEPAEGTSEWWDRRLALWVQHRHREPKERPWNEHWGPQPDQPRCRAPLEILTKHGLRKAA